MEKLQRGIDGQPSPGRRGSRSQALGTLGLTQRFREIIEAMQHGVISDLEAENRYLNQLNFSLNDRVKTMGNPGLAYTLGEKGWRKVLDIPHGVIKHTLRSFGPDGGEWTMSNNWDTIWQILPENIDGILARTQENIYSEAIKPYDIPLLEIYLPRLIILSAPVPIAWDIDNRTLDFLGDDNIQQCLVDLHKSTIDDTEAKGACKFQMFHSYSFKSISC